MIPDPFALLWLCRPYFENASSRQLVNSLPPKLSLGRYYSREVRRSAIRCSISRSRAVACASNRSPSGPPCLLARSLTSSSRERCCSSCAISSLTSARQPIVAQIVSPAALLYRPTGAESGLRRTSEIGASAPTLTLRPGVSRDILSGDALSRSAREAARES